MLLEQFQLAMLHSVLIVALVCTLRIPNVFHVEMEDRLFLEVFNALIVLMESMQILHRQLVWIANLVNLLQRGHRFARIASLGFFIIILCASLVSLGNRLFQELQSVLIALLDFIQMEENNAKFVKMERIPILGKLFVFFVNLEKLLPLEIHA